MPSVCPAINTALLPAPLAPPPRAPVRLRTGLLGLGVALVTVAVMAWLTARTAARVASLEMEHARSAGRLNRVEQVIGGFPTTTASATPVAGPNQ
ncbi:MAG: hypothetical protein GW783_09110 [Deltaproteobacteria bacterium]|nr:hypothetical protein [Deltaproteobacteria bacterium]NCP95097.1 hypothetical protein [Deltaproteobacteria bacterium]NCS74266.1 hypothetical protein [Deltaproteobacteria bacterium]